MAQAGAGTKADDLAFDDRTAVQAPAPDEGNATVLMTPPPQRQVVAAVAAVPAPQACSPVANGVTQTDSHATTQTDPRPQRSDERRREGRRERAAPRVEKRYESGYVLARREQAEPPAEPEVWHGVELQIRVRHI